MKRQDGIALIATLLIMAAIMALGVGTLFLSTMNLKIAENSRTHAVARYNAEAGLEAAVVKLKKDYEASNPKQFPDTLTLPISPDTNTVTYEVIGTQPENSKYAPYTTGPLRTQARVVVVGTGPNNARYQAEALFGPLNGINPALLLGLTAEGPIHVTGGGRAEFINAGVHSNTSVDLTGYSNSVFRKCADPQQDFSTCAVANLLPVSTNGGNCSMSGCNQNASKISIDPAYTVKRNDAIAVATFGLVKYRDAGGNTVSDGRGGVLYADPAAPSVSININPEVNPEVYKNRCTVVYSTSNPPPATILSVGPGAKICAKDGLSLNFASGIDMSDATVVADGNITFGGANIVNGTAGTLKNTKLISRTTLSPTATDDGSGSGGVMLDNVTGEALTIFTGANRNVSEPVSSNNKAPYYLVGSGFELTGNTTIASNRDIQFEGKTQLTRYPDKPGAVTTAIISTRKILNNGSSDFYGVFWAGQCFKQNGSSRIYGSIAVKNGGCESGNGNAIAIDISGSLKIDASYSVDNSSLYEEALGVTVFSRR